MPKLPRRCGGCACPPALAHFFSVGRLLEDAYRRVVVDEIQDLGNGRGGPAQAECCSCLTCRISRLIRFASAALTCVSHDSHNISKSGGDDVQLRCWVFSSLS